MSLLYRSFAFAMLALVLAPAACAPKDACLRHSDCDADERCRDGRCRSEGAAGAIGGSGGAGGADGTGGTPTGGSGGG